MQDENTGFASLSIDEAAQKLKQSREAAMEAEAEAPEDIEEIEEDQAEAETDAEEELPEDAEEVEDDQSEEDPDEDAEPEEDESAIYEVEGVEFTLSELREWQKNGLRQSDYTKKTQEVSEARKAFEAERQTWEAERTQVVEHLRGQQAQLEDALATFAIEQDPQPKRSEFRSTDEYLEAQEGWGERQAKKARAREALQALQAQQVQEVQSREFAKLYQHFPEWRDPKVMLSKRNGFVEMGQAYGLTADDIDGINDHRFFRVLNDLHALQEEAATRQQSAKTAEKKVVKAVKPLTPGAKPAKNQSAKDLRKSQERLKKSGSMQDAVAAMRAKRRAG